MDLVWSNSFEYGDDDTKMLCLYFTPKFKFDM